MFTVTFSSSSQFEELQLWLLLLGLNTNLQH